MLAQCPDGYFRVNLVDGAVNPNQHTELEAYTPVGDKSSLGYRLRITSNQFFSYAASVRILCVKGVPLVD